MKDEIAKMIALQIALQRAIAWMLYGIGFILCVWLGMEIRQAHAGIDGASTVRRVALEEGVPAKLALAVASVESGLDCEAPDSPAGAVGIMQTMPATAAAMGVSRAELLTCEGAARAGVRYLKAALDRTDGDRASAAHLYFAGLNAEPTRSSAYARAVMAAMHRF